MSSKKIASLSVLVAVSLILFMVESLIPPLFPIAPYVKIGLSNSILIFVLIVYGEKESLIFMLIKNLLGCLILGNWYAFPFNISGSFFSLIIMMLLYKYCFPKISIISISIAGAIISNITRTAVGAIIMQTAGLLLDLPIIAIISVGAGILIGLITIMLIKYLPDKIIKQ
jgi:heptaprenyl diphosphate synthase